MSPWLPAAVNKYSAISCCISAALHSQNCTSLNLTALFIAINAITNFLLHSAPVNFCCSYYTHGRRSVDLFLSPYFFRGRDIIILMYTVYIGRLEQLNSYKNYLNCCHQIQILRLKCTKFNFGLGSAPEPAGGVNRAPQVPSWILGPSSKGRGGERRDGRDPHYFPCGSMCLTTKTRKHILHSQFTQ